MGSTIEVILTIIGLSFWILFPIGIFLSLNHVDKNTDQLIHLKKLRHRRIDPKYVCGLKNKKVYQPVPFDWHHPVAFFRRWPKH